MLNMEPIGWRYRIGSLLPAPAFLGVILWKTMGTWIALPAFAIGLITLPIPYIVWFVLNNSRRFLGDDKPSGKIAVIWNTGMVIALIIILISVIFSIINIREPLINMIGRLF